MPYLPASMLVSIIACFGRTVETVKSAASTAQAKAEKITHRNIEA